MIRREDDDHPTSPTADGPSWLDRGGVRPAAQSTAPAERTASPRTPYATTQAADTQPDPASGTARSPAPPLRRVQQFMLLERIGQGGMGEVFAAFDENLGRKVAIKLVAPQTRGDRARQRLLREAQALARLSHPNVVTVYEVGALPDGGLFIAMELVSGQTLRAWQLAHRRAWREIVAVYADAGRGLAAAHKSGIVHRDFKPDNVLVGDDGRVRVADFGLAFAADAAPDARPPDARPPEPAPARESARIPAASVAMPVADASAALPVADVTAGSPPARRSGSLFARASASLRRVDASAAVPLAELSAALRATDSPSKLADASAAMPVTDAGAALPVTDASAAMPVTNAGAALPVADASAALPVADIAAELPRTEASAALSTRSETSSALPVVDTRTEPPAGDSGHAAPRVIARSGSQSAAPAAPRSSAAQAALRPEEVTAALSRIAPGAAVSARPASEAPGRDASAALPRDEISTALPIVDTSAVLPPLIEESAAMSPLADEPLPFFDPDAEQTGVDVRTTLLRLDTNAALPDGDPSGELPPVEPRAAWSSADSTGVFPGERPLASPSPDLGRPPLPGRHAGRGGMAPSAPAGAPSRAAVGTPPHVAASAPPDRAATHPLSIADSGPPHGAPSPARIAGAARSNIAAGNAVLGPTADIESTMDLDPDLLLLQSPALRLTAAGRFVGTPGYMAPEQLTGTAVDARADQYSFCVALHEALHGERPAPDSATASRRGEPAPYPRWLADVLERGLSPEPAGRFATMDALLAELTRSRERTRRRTAVAVLLSALLAAATAVVVVRSTAEPPPCPLATDELTGVWDATTRQRSQAALLATSTPYASSVWTSTAAAFDRYAGRWLAAQQAACQATHVRHVQSAALLDRRMECLASRRRSLAAATDVLQHQPEKAVSHASELIDSLGDIELCADTGVLLAQSGPGAGPSTPADAATRARAAAVRQQLAHASALLAAGDVAAAEPVVATAERLARDIHDDALRAEVLFAQARVKATRGEADDMTRLANDAVQLATASHHDELQADIWLMLARTAGTFERQPKDIQSWLQNAEAWIQRLGHSSDSRRVQLEYARGKARLAAGQPRVALDVLSSAVTQAEAMWGKEDPRLVRLLDVRATAEGQLQQAKAAVADAERALAIGIKAWGPAHPAVAQARRTLGFLYIEQTGELDRGEQELSLALQTYQAQRDVNFLEIANCEQVLSKAQQYRGDYAKALEHAESAERIYAQRLSSTQPARGEALMAIGVLRHLRKDFAGSLEAYRQAELILSSALGPHDAVIGILHSNMGETLLALHRTQPAVDEFERALRMLRANLGPEHADLALPLKGLGLAHIQRGRFDAALAPLESALALRTRSAAEDPQELAEIRWGLARTLHALGRDPARARELAVAAAQGYRTLGQQSADRAEEIERWLEDGKR